MRIRAGLEDGSGRLARTALYRTPGVQTIAARVRPRACVLVYHRVGESRIDPYGQAVSTERFARHLDVLRDRYDVIAVDDLLARFQDRDYRDGTVVVTFDDGYADTLTHAYPIAEAHGVPLHVFVTAEPVATEEGQFWWDELATLASQQGTNGRRLHDELRELSADARRARLSSFRTGNAPRAAPHSGRPLTRAELVELAGLPFAAIGAHTLTHPQLAALPVAEQVVELVEGRRQLEALTGHSVDVLAYPFGKERDVSGETRRLAAEAGYAGAFLTTPRALVPSSDRYGLPRLTAHDWPVDMLLHRITRVLGPLRR